MGNYTGNDSYTQSIFRASGGVSTLFNADGTRLYVATSDGRIETYDTASGAKLSSWSVGGLPGGMTLSEDGATLLVTVPGGDGASAGLIRQFDTATGARTSIRGEYSFHDIEIVDGGHRLQLALVILRRRIHHRKRVLAIFHSECRLGCCTPGLSGHRWARPPRPARPLK